VLPQLESNANADKARALIEKRFIEVHQFNGAANRILPPQYLIIHSKYKNLFRLRPYKTPFFFKTHDLSCQLRLSLLKIFYFCRLINE
jgi:hypothetical protein